MLISRKCVFLLHARLFDRALKEHSFSVSTFILSLPVSLDDVLISFEYLQHIIGETGERIASKGVHTQEKKSEDVQIGPKTFG